MRVCIGKKEESSKGVAMRDVAAAVVAGVGRRIDLKLKVGSASRLGMSILEAIMVCVVDEKQLHMEDEKDVSTRGGNCDVIGRSSLLVRARG
jgi:hypothetical protein